MAIAFLVLGAESSGTRLLTSILINAGCLGNAGHEQPFDKEIPAGKEHIVWRRSIPHGREWVDIEELIQKLQHKGYKVKALVTMREWYAGAHSQVKNNHAKSTEEAFTALPRAYRHIFKALINTNIPYEIVIYEALILHSEWVQKKLLNRQGIEMQKAINIYDGNIKYYQGDARG